MKKRVLSTGLVLSVLCILLLGFSSCQSDNDVTHLYAIHSSGKYSESTNDTPPTDAEKVKTYLESKGCSTKVPDFMHSGKSKNDCDNKAKADFDNYISKLSKDDAAKLGLKKGTSFGFVLYRAAEQGVEEIEEIARWEYTEQ